MKRVIVLAVAAMLPLLSQAEAQTNCQRIGNSTYCDNGLSSQTGAPAPYAPNRSGCAGAPSCR
jgi:hypothetical protein